MSTPEWSAERMEYLRRRWTDGASATVIGKEMGVSRNAIIGKSHRLKLESRKKAPGPKKPKNVIPYRPRGATRRYLNDGPKINAVPMVPEIIDDTIPHEQRLTVLTLTYNRCHFPVGDPGTEEFFYCGGKVPDDEGRRYCAGHRNRMFQPIRKRVAKEHVKVNYTDRLDRYMG